MNTFINFVNRFLLEKRTRSGIRALEGVEALLLPVLDLPVGPWVPMSSSCSLVRLAKGLTQELCRMVQDPGAIVKDRGLNVFF